MASILKGHKEALIASGGSLSSIVGILKNTVMGLLMPEVWTAADITFQGSMDRLDWNEITEVPQLGMDVAVYQVQAPAANQAIPLDMAVFAPWNYIRVRSGTAAIPVVQAAARQLYVATWSE